MDYKFHLLGRAVIRFKNKVLLAHAIGYDNTFLPGGHVEIGESIPVAIARELHEELGLEVQVEHYLGAVEASFVQNITHFEVNHVFEVVLNEEIQIVSKESHLEFFWADVANLEQHNLKPMPLIQMLPQNVSAFWGSALA